MSLEARLADFKHYAQIDKDICELVFKVRQRLQDYWQADVNTAQVEMMLVHLACSLGRIQRGHCVSPLYQEFLEEIRSAVEFGQVLLIHQDLLQLLPDNIPQAEQSYYLANIYSLLLDQKGKIRE